MAILRFLLQTHLSACHGLQCGLTSTLLTSSLSLGFHFMAQEHPRVNCSADDFIFRSYRAPEDFLQSYWWRNQQTSLPLKDGRCATLQSVQECLLPALHDVGRVRLPPGNFLYTNGERRVYSTLRPVTSCRSLAVRTGSLGGTSKEPLPIGFEHFCRRGKVCADASPSDHFRAVRVGQPNGKLQF